MLSLAIGIGLSAACGFRVFVPFLVMSIAAQAGYLQLANGWEWIGSTPAIIAFAVAAILEIVAYYVPWLDNLLDTVATPAAVVAKLENDAVPSSGCPGQHPGPPPVAPGRPSLSDTAVTVSACG